MEGGGGQQFFDFFLTRGAGGVSSSLIFSFKGGREKSPKSLISKSLNAHEHWSCAPSVPKKQNSGAHGMACCAPRISFFEKILIFLFSYFF